MPTTIQYSHRRPLIALLVAGAHPADGQISPRAGPPAHRRHLITVVFPRDQAEFADRRPTQILSGCRDTPPSCSASALNAGSPPSAAGWPRWTAGFTSSPTGAGQ